MARYLADKSALARMPNAIVSARLRPLIEAGEIATCGIVALEVLWSARSPQDLRDTRQELQRSLSWVPTTDADFQRALDVMQMLTDAGRHRDAKIPDLVLAAVAERAGLTVLHYDRDFDAIASVTGQPMEWIVPSGSVP
ncbi:MAG: PIN domain nuclease [Chloroflexota bacterium]